MGLLVPGFSCGEWLRGLWTQTAQAGIPQPPCSGIFQVPTWSDSPHFSFHPGVPGDWAVWTSPTGSRILWLVLASATEDP